MSDDELTPAEQGAEAGHRDSGPISVKAEHGPYYGRTTNPFSHGSKAAADWATAYHNAFSANCPWMAFYQRRKQP